MLKLKTILDFKEVKASCHLANSGERSYRLWKQEGGTWNAYVVVAAHAEEIITRTDIKTAKQACQDYEERIGEENGLESVCK